MRRERGTTRIATSSDAKRLFRTRPLTPKSTQSKIGSARGKAKTRVADASVHTNAARANELVVCNRRALKLSQRDAPNSGRKSVSLMVGIDCNPRGKPAEQRPASEREIVV